MTLDLEALEDPITRILTAPGTDLSTISAKRVRKALLGDPQYAHLGLTPDVLKTRRKDVDQVIAQIFEHVNRAASSGGSKRKREEDDVDGGEEVGEGDVQAPTEPGEDGGEDEDVAPKSPKKKKGKKSVEESDAALARKLSTEINSRSRRGASLTASVSSPRKAKRKAKKSPETVESEEEDEDGAIKPKKRSAAKGGFAKEYTLSAPLSAVLEIEKLSRPQVVKKLWEYIRKHALQNPSNKKEIVCDDALRAVFAVDKIDMFRMNKVLGQHLHEG
ncbi:SWIB-domain-containing protein [Imleria badia]|nr:SWIB-domain-containing protein [Imleria badia]